MHTIYHTPQDDLHQKVRLGGRRALRAAGHAHRPGNRDAPTRPTWNARDFFGVTFARKAP
jgi:hypothetical protein